MLLVLAGFVVPSWASKPLAPSRIQAACQKALLSSGLWQPEVRATIHSHTPRQIHRHRQDRNLFELEKQGLYPTAYLRPESMRRLRVLDLGCRDGHLVEDLRRRGVNAVGLDPALSAYQKSKHYYIQAEADNTGIESGTVDLVLATLGPLTYGSSGQVQQILRELRRILRPGGRILISAVPVDEVYLRPPFSDLEPGKILTGTGYDQLPSGLRIRNFPDIWWLHEPAENNGYDHANYWLELEKI